jgi:SWI/SNF-related matrix-associated actin-dependent regulator of chromatin subfamily A3
MGLGKSIQALGLIVTNSPKDANVPRTTLIVCPTSVMSSWVKQIEQHLEAGTLKVSQYHGPDRFNLLSKLDDVDVLVTSYGTMKSDFTRFLSRAATDHNCGVPKPESYLFDKRFHRIILDEAHMIRNVKSQAFKGVMALQASHRLCLTGTPIQNKPEDIYALLAFVAGGPLSDQKIFDEAIATPIYFGNPIGLSRLRTVMAHVALRRNKSELALPPKTVELRVVKYPDNCPHKYVHDVLFKSTQMKVRATLSTSTEIVVQKEKMEMLEAIMRVRQACVSGVLVPKTMEHLHVKGKNIRENETKLSMIEMNEYLGPSPKFKALHQAICEMNSDEKGVIFSQFTKVLDLLEPFLQSFGHSYVRLDGSMSLLQRNKSIQEFNAEIGGPRLILCSLRAAGTGITLTRGNHCFMMDPWWNSGVEQQAMDRVSCIIVPSSTFAHWMLAQF